MGKRYLLFKLNRDDKLNLKFTETHDVRIFNIKPWRLSISGGCKQENFHEKFFRFYISILTFGKAKVYYVENEKGEIIHSSYLIPQNFKYPFLKKGEAVIGPYQTNIKYRGQGIYPHVLNFIGKCNPSLNIYMIIRPDNKASINGVKKSGFELCDDTISTTNILKRFYLM